MTPNSPLRRDVGAFELMLIGLGSIIGSGWLFGAWRAAGLAGPDAIWAWVIGAAIVTAIAMTFAELGAMFPESGGMARYGQYSHGSLIGFFAAWANWIVTVSAMPVEAEASAQYMASWNWEWAKALYIPGPNGSGELTPSGLTVAAALVFVYFLTNYWGVKLYARSNTAITLFKLIVPALTAILLIASGFHAENFSVGVDGGPHVTNFSAVLTAVATAGIVFSYNGFQSPVNLAGEARNPGRSIPFAIFGSIVLAALIYVLLQVAFLGAVPTDLLAKAGWRGIDFSSPLAELALLLNLHWLALVLYADAFISPSGAGMTYTATSARLIFGMQKNGTMPAVFGSVDKIYGVPRAAMWLNLAASFVFLFFFRGWGTLAAVLSVAIVITYLTGPIAAMTLRRTAPGLLRPLRIRGLSFFAAIAFISCTELMYWATWPLTAEVILLMATALPIYLYYQAKAGWRDFARHLRGAVWLIVFMPVVAALSYVGSSKFGGRDYIPFGWDLLVVAIVAFAFYLWALRSGWRTPDVEKALG